ncbi:hypothetical protein F4819DRAFT_501578 [Hypoxylon fuscum]|nr:hypothetical protein F4819DRAFT_501578 [Hypoxylon fuscum]
MTSLYDASIPVLTKILQTEVTILEKAEAFARDNDKPITDFLDARLSPDMFPLTWQIGITVMCARKAVELLAGKKLEELQLKDYSLEESHTILAGALKELADVKPESIIVKEQENITFNIGKNVTTTTAQDWMKGVPLGKRDYLAHLIEGWVLS